MNVRSLWLVIGLTWLCMLLAPCAAALEVLNVDSNQTTTALGPHLEYLKDPQRNFDLSAVLTRDQAFVANSAEVINLGYTAAGYWARFRLRNTGGEPLPLFLEFRSRFADHLQLYLPAAGGGYSAVPSGRTVMPSRRPYPSRQFVFPLTLPPHSDHTYYLYADSADTLTLPLYLSSLTGLQQVDFLGHTWITFYQGLICATLVFSLFLFVMVRDRLYVWYIFVIVFHHGLFFALFDGLGYMYFGLENSWWSREALAFFICISMWAIMQFSRKLLNTRANQPLNDKCLVVLRNIAVLTAAISVFADYFISIRITNPVATLTGVLVWIVGWTSYRQRNSAARYFLLAWTSVVIGGLAYSLKSWGFAPSNLFTEYGWQIGSGLEAILLSMAIAERINIEVRTREQSQREARRAQGHALAVQVRANETLEEAVRLRTQELEEANRKLEQMTLTDGLTGMRNRRYLERVLEAEFGRSLREQSSLAVLVLDIDHFKHFNDSYGHGVGDGCLRLVAQSIGAHLKRDSDVCARYGGEEFCVMLPNTKPEGALHVAERIREAVARLEFSVDDRPVPITISIGVVVTVPCTGGSAEQLLAVADEALYESKRGGRNRVTLASPCAFRTDFPAST